MQSVAAQLKARPSSDSCILQAAGIAAHKTTCCCSTHHGFAGLHIEKRPTRPPGVSSHWCPASINMHTATELPFVDQQYLAKREWSSMHLKNSSLPKNGGGGSCCDTCSGSGRAKHALETRPAHCTDGGMRCASPSAQQVSGGPGVSTKGTTCTTQVQEASAAVVRRGAGVTRRSGESAAAHGPVSNHEWMPPAVRLAVLRLAVRPPLLHIAILFSLLRPWPLQGGNMQPCRWHGELPHRSIEHSHTISLACGACPRAWVE